VATIYGTSSNDKIDLTGRYGWNGAAWVLVLASDATTALADTVGASGGDDEVYCGDWADKLYGEDGADQLFGNDGNDILEGGLAGIFSLAAKVRIRCAT